MFRSLKPARRRSFEWPCSSATCSAPSVHQATALIASRGCAQLLSKQLALGRIAEGRRMAAILGIGRSAGTRKGVQAICSVVSPAVSVSNMLIVKVELSTAQCCKIIRIRSGGASQRCLHVWQLRSVELSPGLSGGLPAHALACHSMSAGAGDTSCDSQSRRPPGMSTIWQAASLPPLTLHERGWRKVTLLLPSHEASNLGLTAL